MLRVISVPTSINSQNNKTPISEREITRFVMQHQGIVDKLMNDFSMYNYPEKDDIRNMAMLVFCDAYRTYQNQNPYYYFLPIRNYLKTICHTIKIDHKNSPIVTSVENLSVKGEEGNIPFEAEDTTVDQLINSLDELIDLERIENQIKPKAREYLRNVLQVVSDNSVKTHRAITESKVRKTEKHSIFRSIRLKRTLKNLFGYSSKHSRQMENEIIAAMNSLNHNIAKHSNDFSVIGNEIKEEIGLCCEA